MHQLQLTVETQWDQQPDRHPHRVAHFGHFAFRPLSPLSFIDNGVNPYVGNSVFLEAHKQNANNFSSAADAPNTLRFGELTIGSILQIFVPLFIITLVFGQYRQERDGALMSMHYVSGVSPGQFHIGKILGNLTIILISALPTWLVCLALIAFSTNPTAVWYRFFLLSLTYLAYLFIVTGIVVAGFSRIRNPRAALATLLAIWLVAVVITPRLLPLVAEATHPAPTAAEFNRQLHQAVSKSVNAHNISDPRFIAEKDRLLKKYGVDQVGQLPFNFRGFGMKIGEESSTQIYRKQLAQLQDHFRRQNRLMSWFGFINPLVSVRQISQLLSGSDYEHATNFELQAEEHRYQFIQHLNELHMHKINFQQDRAQKLSHSFWQEFKDFRYQLPTTTWVGKRALLLSLSLFFWMVAITLTLFRLKVRMS